RPIRSSPGGALVGTAPAGTGGRVIDGPQIATLNSVSYAWWNVTWDTGASGWSADFMRAPRFRAADRVEAAVDGLKIRATPAGGEIGSVILGAVGTISSSHEPTGAFLGGVFYIW